METKQALTQARDLIKQKRYDDARNILVNVNHPLAEQWLERIDQLAPQSAAPPQKRQTTAMDGDARGRQLAEYGINQSQLIRRLILGVLSIPMIILMFQFFPRNFQLNAESLIAGGIPILIVLGMLMITLPALIAVVGGRKTTLYEHGVERKSLTGTTFVRWDELDGVQGGLTNSRAAGISLWITGAYMFFVNEKKVFDVTSLDANYDQLYAQLNKQIVNTHTQPLLARYRRGEDLKFARLYVRQDGLHLDNDFLPRDQMGEVVINRRFFFLNRSNGKTWKRYPIEQCSSPYLVLAVVNAIVNGR